MNENPYSHSQSRLSRNFLAALILRLDSVWLGITLMVLIFLYMSIASAGLLHPVDWNQPFGPWTRWVVRESLGLTEMEAFAWWPFTALIFLFVLNMIVVTIRRIRLNVLNAGVWAIHTGIVILALGSVYYFGTKLEGDTLVFRRHILIEVPGAEPARLIAQLGAATQVRGRDGVYQFAVQDIQPNWPLLSGGDAGKTACSVNVAVTAPTQSFIRQMLIGYPQYTEDILPGQGRAIKSLGRKLVDEDLRLTFGYEPQNYFYLMDSAALYVREVGSTQWIERPISGLPHYSNHIAFRDEIWQPEGEKPLVPDPLHIEVPAVIAGDPLTGLDVRVTGRVHYVEAIESRWVAGSGRQNPYLSVELVPSDGARERVDLLALHPQQRSAKDGMLEFCWAASAADVAQFATRVGNMLTIQVPDENIDVTLPVDDWADSAANPKQTFTALPGSTWSYRIAGFSRNLQIANHAPVSVVSLELRQGSQTIRRFVFADAAQTHDRTPEGTATTADPRILTSYRPGPALLFIGGPAPHELVAVVNTPDTRVPLEIGKSLDLGHGLTISVREMFPEATLDRRMALTPKRLQDGGIGAQLSQIKVELASGSWSTKLWLPYHHYPFADAQYAGRRFMYSPQVVALPGGRNVELLYSRKRWPMPAAVTLDDFELLTHVGGFVPGNTTSVRDFVSILRSYRDGAWSDRFRASLNKPANEGGIYYFQSTWDPGSMAYTGLGVGNRNGVYIQLAGCCIAVLGMIYVFYVKPMIKRRRRVAVWATAAADQNSAERATVGAV